MLLMAVGAVFALILATVVVFVPTRGIAIAGYGLFVFESTFIVTSLYVGMQMLTPDGFRGIAASFNMMIYTLAGLGLGPIAVGAISDVVGGTRSLAWGVVGVEAMMCAVILPVALLCRRRFERRAGSIRADA